MSAGLAEHGYGEGLRRRLRRRLMLAAIAIGVAMASAGGLWWAQKLMTAGLPPGEAPLLRADGRPFKMRPQDRGGMAVPNVDRLIYEPDAAKNTVEHLLPPPEEPLPPSALPGRTPGPPPGAGAAQAASPPPEPPPAAAPQKVDAAPPPAPAPSQAAAPRPPAATPAPEPHAGAPPKPAGSVRLQLGAVRSESGARTEWERLRQRHADLLGSLGLAVTRFDDPSRGTFFRLQAGPVDAAAAERICGELKRRRVGCLVVR
jgi:cell division septation protein DedD